MNPLERRKQALTALLALPRPTTKAIPYSEWPAPPVVNWELWEDFLQWYIYVDERTETQEKQTRDI
jgi:hypothetical protein